MVHDVEKRGNIRPKINKKMSPFAVASGPVGPISMPYILLKGLLKKIFLHIDRLL